ncbi:MAG: hypothetical protein IJH71_00230 [Eubacterium sp.]|nr:hypothetical protein [Eubacterium sp.]
MDIKIIESDGKVHLPGRTIPYCKPGQQPIVRLTVEAYNALIDITNASSLSVGKVASEIILQSQDRIVYEKEEMNG